MKPYRKANWEISWRERDEIISQLREQHGYTPMSYEEREVLRKNLSAGEFEALMKERDLIDTAIRADLDNELSKLAEVGQVNLNMRNNDLDAFCAVFQRADRILTGLSNVEVGVADEAGQESPAWSDGKSVTFNVSKLKEVSEDTLLSLHGLNYHEVSHLLYTPRVGSELGAWVKENGSTKTTTEFNPDTLMWEEKTTGDVRYQYIFNLLEDFRAENYLITKYPSVIPFLTAVIADYATSNEKLSKELDSVFILLAGRAYLPNELVRLSAEAYARANGIDKTRQLFTLANEYRTMVFPRDYARAKEIIELLKDILPSFPSMPNGCQHRPVLRNGRPEGSNEQEKLAGNSSENALSQEELNKMFDEIMSKPQDGNGQGNSHDSNGSAKSNENGDGLSDQLAEALEQAVQNAKKDQSVQKKLAETNKAIKKQSSTKCVLPRQNRTMASPNASDVTAVRMFAQELERIRIDSDPDWKRELPTGKLNVRRAINADVNDINKLFDRWSTGNDDYDIEAVIALDRSGSMSWRMTDTSKAGWIIKRALEKINASVTVLTFNDTSRVLYTAEEKAGSNFADVYSSGSTEPQYALVETERIMLNSRRKTKLFFLLTDGQFYGGKNDDIIKNLNNSGVLTRMVFLGNEQWVNYAKEKGEMISHGVQNFRVINKPLDLVKVAKDIVKSHIQHA